jgi:hypothetical protein
MDWIQEELKLSQAPTLGAALASMTSWSLDGIPLSSPPSTLPGVNPMAGFPTTGFVDPMADLIVGSPAPSPPGFGGMPLSGPVITSTVSGTDLTAPAVYDPYPDHSR